MFDADRPIQKSEQDRLNRAVFAKYLARCMLDHSDPESLVLGLYGGWGVGKTSIINLIVEELKFAANNIEDSEKPIILNFSPWSYSGQQQLIYNFFRRLSSTLRGVNYLENANRIIHLLELYVSFFTHQPVPKSLRNKRTLWQQFTFQREEEVYAWESGRDLTLVKAELNELLRQQKHKIIIIIDNISRLDQIEIKQIFQIVKSIGDYANTVYLLAFDKDQVAKTLGNIDEGGDKFIEKIVQLPFTVPPISPHDIEKIFADRMQAVMETIPADAWDTEYWADLYYSSLKYFFENVRDITRYVNTLSFSYERMRDLVNPVDFFALTAIEVFLPAVYSRIRHSKDLFTDLLDQVYKIDGSQLENERLRCEEILSHHGRLSREMLLQLLINLFPRLRKIYQPHSPFYYSEVLARKTKRICSPDLFQAYFRLSIQAGIILPAEFEMILSLAANTASFDQAVNRLNQDNRITAFLDNLDSPILTTVPNEHIQTIISVLLDNGDLFTQGVSGPLCLDTPMRIHRIIHHLLQHFENTADRFLILQHAIAHANKSLYILVHELREQAREHNETSNAFIPATFRDLTSEQLSCLQTLAVSRIEMWAQNGSLFSHPRLLALLYAWRDWGDQNHCQQAILQWTNTDVGLLTFFTTTLEHAINSAMTAYKKDTSWGKCLEHINAFILPNQLESHAKSLFESPDFEKLSEREQLALMIFLDLIHAKTEKIIAKTSI